MTTRRAGDLRIVDGREPFVRSRHMCTLLVVDGCSIAVYHGIRRLVSKIIVRSIVRMLQAYSLYTILYCAFKGKLTVHHGTGDEFGSLLFGICYVTTAVFLAGTSNYYNRFKSDTGPLKKGCHTVIPECLSDRGGLIEEVELENQDYPDLAIRRLCNTELVTMMARRASFERKIQPSDGVAVRSSC
jgi:hypothetical protein